MPTHKPSKRLLSQPHTHSVVVALVGSVFTFVSGGQSLAFIFKLKQAAPSVNPSNTDTNTSTMAKTSGSITLKGSANTVTEFFSYGINSILYQRGIYPPEQFERVKKYGLPLFITADTALKTFIDNITGQLHDWLVAKTVQKVVLVLTSVTTSEVLERWQFDIECDNSVDENTVVDKPEKETRDEIQAIIRQICSSVTFLPMLEEQCSFDMLIYTDKDAETPANWEESDAKLVKNAAEVFQLRSFSTGIHSVHSAVTYKDDM
eukprot:m.361788 g.361788  ORF g.361788 m.361788 type:complete len:262 (+) comp19895_c0_seq1:48-833(+)